LRPQPHLLRYVSSDVARSSRICAEVTAWNRTQLRNGATRPGGARPMP